MDDMKDLLSNLSPEEYQLTMNILKEMEEDGKSEILHKLYETDYEEIPVDIDTFIESPRYAGWMTNNGKSIYPYWRARLREIFDESKSYSEVALTGSIGIGKSSIAIVALGYTLYRLMCLKDAHTFYDLSKGNDIYIVFFNATLALSQSVAYTKFQSMLMNSPWFMERGKISGLKYKEYIPNKAIRFAVGSQVEHSLGRDVYAGLMDELNFIKGADPVMEKSKVMTTYVNILERLSSRFMVRGKVAGKLFLVSSKKSEDDFMESYIRRQQGKSSIYVADAPLWEVKPTGTYSGKTFVVAAGGSNMASKVLLPEEDPQEYERRGYTMLNVPIEFKDRFELDINTALMNIAGISISHVTKFITYEQLSKCYTEDKNPFTNNILTIGMHDTYLIKEFFIPNLVPYDIHSRPIFIHIDTSLTGDRTGIGAVAVMGYKYSNEYSIEESKTVPTKRLAFKQVFAVGIQCPDNSEISFQKTRDFIYYLRHELGWNIKGISLDGYQSSDSRQQFISMGFDNTKIVSLDRTPDGYMTFKAAIYEKRIAILDIPEQETEIINLNRDNMTGKVDHPVGGSKDISDGSAGSLYHASLNEDNLNLHSQELAEISVDVNELDGETNTDVGDSLLEGLVSRPTSLKDNTLDLSDNNSNIDVDNIRRALETLKRSRGDLNKSMDEEMLEDVLSSRDFDDGFII